MEEGYTLRQNATFHFNNILSNTRTGSSILRFTIYLNSSFFQAPGSLTLQLKDENSAFTTYFSFSTGTTTDVIFFNDSNIADTTDQLRVSRSVVNDQLRVSRSVVKVREAPTGEYQAQLIATVSSMAESELSPQEHTDNSTVIIRVTKGMYVTSAMHY